MKEHGELIQLLSMEMEPDTLHQIVARIERYVNLRISHETASLRKQIDTLIDRVIERDARIDQSRLYRILEGAFHPDKERER